MKRILFYILLLITILPPLSIAQERPKIGLVLSGGGARGAAHVGVLKVLEENNIPIDYIVGTSMGAIVGGFYASGMSVEEMERIFNDTDWANLFQDKPSDKYLTYRQKAEDKRFMKFKLGFNKFKLTLPKGLIAGQKLDFLLKKLSLHTINIQNFDNLTIPYRAVAADIETGAAIVIKKGSLAKAMRASMAVPAVFNPVEIDGRLLVDGGIVKNLPIDVAKNLGADIIIAVDVGFPLSKKSQMHSAVDISAQVLTIMTQQNVKEQKKILTNDDILITPDLGYIASTNFDKTVEMIALGEKSAQEQIKKLKKHSQNRHAQKGFITAKKSFRINKIRIAPTKKISKERIKGKLKTKGLSTITTEELTDDLINVYSIGAFDKVSFNIDDYNDLEIETSEKDWGPNYIRFGLNIEDDFEGSGHYNFSTEYTMTELNKLGAQLKTEFQIGRTRKIYSEFYQPLDYSDFFFIAPQLLYERSIEDIYKDDTRIAQYKTSSTYAQIDLGINLGTAAQARVGILSGKTKARPFIGEYNLPHYKLDQSAIVSSLNFDQLDNYNFPKHGLSSSIDFFMTNEDLGNDESYKKLYLNLLNASSHKKHTLLTQLRAGTKINDEIPLYDEFTLGGFFNMSGYRKGQLRGQYVGQATFAYYYELFDLPLGKSVYIGGSFELGNVWDKSHEIKVDDLLLCGSLFIGADTFFGPLYLGYGTAQGNSKGRIYLYLGQTF